MNNWLSYFYPSTVMFVDDQQAFLTVLKNKLPPQTLALFSNNAQQALNKIINKVVPPYKNLQHFHEAQDNIELDLPNNTEALFNIKIGNISKISYNLDRFSEISVVIVDQMMPGLDGICFCRELINHPVKKIMLTASKNQSIATNAFNEGIIDFFLPKDSPNLISQLTHVIKKMQKDYFSSANKLTLGVTLEKILPIPNLPTLSHFLQNMMSKLNAEEFYLLDRHGSMLFIQYDGTPITLVISSEEMLKNYTAIAQEHEELAIAQFLSKREKLLFFPHEMDSMRPVKEWENFLFDAQELSSLPYLFYTLITDIHSQSIDTDSIRSLKTYMTNN